MFVSKILIRLLQIVILIWIIIYFDSIFVLGRAVPVPGKKSSTGPTTAKAAAPKNWHTSRRNMTEKNHTVNLGLIFGKNSKDLNDVVGFAINQNSNNHYKPHVEFNLFVDVISTADAFKLSRLVCNKFTRGVIAMIGDVPSDSFNTLQAYANAFEIPFVMSWFPEKVPASPENEYAVSLRPDSLQAIIDTVIYYGWKSIIYIFDSDDGLLRLQQLYRSLVPGKERFQISHVRRVSTALEVTSFLVSIERETRWSNKYVVFHCDVQLAKGAIIAHVNNVELGRRNYHYFFTELIMDEPWEKNVEAYGAINITGLRVLDPSNNLLRNFKALWQPNRTTPTTAFVYDGVQVLIDTVRRMLVKYPEFLAVSTLRNSSDSKIVDCISQTDQIPYEFGKKWSRIIKKTDLEGVTGHIHFDESGHRQNFSLQVVEMNNSGEIVQIANWHDLKGFMPLNGKLPEKKEVGYYDRSKTYVVSTILEFPFVIEEKKEYQSATPKLMGFCIDLAKLILEKMEIPSYEIRLVNDGKYGSPNPKEEGGWDGLVGELVRHEADLVIAPLVINNERQNVVDFSHPFLSYGDKTKGNIQPKVYTMFSFLTPMSLELWISIVVSVLVVSLCMTLVTKLSPHERRIVYVYDGNDSTTRAILVNEFNLRNAIWYALGAFLQQGTDLHPRSWSGRILSGVWCAFSMILVANYTANMSSNLTMARFGEPLQAYTKVTSCPKDQWTPKMQPPSEGEDGDHPSLGFIPSSYSHDEAPCELFISNSNSAVKEFAAAFPKGSKLRDGVNQALHALRAEGALQQLVRYWLINIKCTVQSEIQGRELTLSQFSGLFYTLAAGLTLGVVAGVVEFIRDRRKQAAAELPRNQDIELMPRRRQLREEPDQLGWHVRPYPQFYALQDAQEETDQQASSSRV